MKKDPLACANAAAVTTVIIYFTCALAVMLLPNFTMTVAKSWFHGIDLSLISTWNITPSSLVLGLITATAYAWAIGFFFAVSYNFFLKK